jgi:hypothetical protein
VNSPILQGRKPNGVTECFFAESCNLAVNDYLSYAEHANMTTINSFQSLSIRHAKGMVAKKQCISKKVAFS